MSAGVVPQRTGQDTMELVYKVTAAQMQEAEQWATEKLAAVEREALAAMRDGMAFEEPNKAFERAPAPSRSREEIEAIRAQRAARRAAKSGRVPETVIAEELPVVVAVPVEASIVEEASVVYPTTWVPGQGQEAAPEAETTAVAEALAEATATATAKSESESRVWPAWFQQR